MSIGKMIKRYSESTLRIPLLRNNGVLASRVDAFVKVYFPGNLVLDYGVGAGAHVTGVVAGLVFGYLHRRRTRMQLKDAIIPSHNAANSRN